MSATFTRSGQSARSSATAMAEARLSRAFEAAGPLRLSAGPGRRRCATTSDPMSRPQTSRRVARSRVATWKKITPESEENEPGNRDCLEIAYNGSILDREKIKFSSNIKMVGEEGIQYTIIINYLQKGAGKTPPLTIKRNFQRRPHPLLGRTAPVMAPPLPAPDRPDGNRTSSLYPRGSRPDRARPVLPQGLAATL